jgi:hypothetical protein
VELRTAVTFGKRRTNLQDPQEDPRAGIREVSKRDVQWVAEGEKQDLVEGSAPHRARRQVPDVVEGSTPSRTEKETADRAGAGNVEAPAPTTTEREDLR